MFTRYTHQNVTWIDFENPTAEEVVAVANEFELGSALIDELLTPTAKPRVDLYPDLVYAVLHFPALRYTHGLETNHEVDIVIGKQFIITTHYSTVSATYDLAKAFEAADLLQGKQDTASAGLIFLELMQRLYQSADDELNALEDTIESIEEHIFEGREREMVSAISFASRELLTHKRLLTTHTDVLQTLETSVKALFGENVSRYIRAATTLHYRVHTRALIMNDVLNELRDTNMALLYTRQNETMKNLTIMAFVTFPLTLIAAIFGMNTVHTPVLGTENDFYYILAGMLTLTILFFSYFKLRKWF